MKTTRGEGPDSREVQAPREALFTPDFTADHKRWATFQASAALDGVLTWQARNEKQAIFIVSAYGRTRDFTDLDAAEQWLAVVTGEKSHG